eukprot:sb/3470302/
MLLSRCITPSLLPSLSSLRYKFTLQPDEIQTSNMTGWGSGGSRVASTKNCAVLRHIPTGIEVKCHETRDLERNKKIALKWLTDKVEERLLGEESSVAKRREKKRIKNEAKKEKSREEMVRRTAENKLKRAETNQRLAEGSARADMALRNGVHLQFPVDSLECEEEEECEEDDLLSSEGEYSENSSPPPPSLSAARSLFGSPHVDDTKR